MQKVNLKFNWVIPLLIFLLIIAIFILCAFFILYFFPHSNLKYNQAFDTVITKIIFLVVFFIVYKFYPFDRGILKLKIDLKNLLFALLVGFVLFIVVNFLLYFQRPGFSEFKYTDNWTYILSIVSACLLAPIIEELLFRGIIFYNLLQRYSFWFSAIYSSLLFSLVHISLSKLIPMFVVGITLCWVLKKERKIIYCCIIHATISILNRMMDLLL